MASPVRLLVLGILNFEPEKSKNGYEILQTLVSWDAENWTTITYGSIHFALKKMAQEGLVRITNNATIEDSGCILYQITPEGQDEFKKMLRQQWWEVKPHIDSLQVAVVFMHQMPKEDLLLALEHREQQLHYMVKSMKYLVPVKMEKTGAPRHIEELFAITVAHMNTELAWIEKVKNKIQNNELP